MDYENVGGPSFYNIYEWLILWELENLHDINEKRFCDDSIAIITSRSQERRWSILQGIFLCISSSLSRQTFAIH